MTTKPHLEANTPRAEIEIKKSDNPFLKRALAITFLALAIILTLVVSLTALALYFNLGSLTHLANTIGNAWVWIAFAGSLVLLGLSSYAVRRVFYSPSSHEKRAAHNPLPDPLAMPYTHPQPEPQENQKHIPRKEPKSQPEPRKEEKHIPREEPKLQPEPRKDETPVPAPNNSNLITPAPEEGKKPEKACQVSIKIGLHHPQLQCESGKSLKKVMLSFLQENSLKKFKLIFNGQVILTERDLNVDDKDKTAKANKDSYQWAHDLELETGTCVQCLELERTAPAPAPQDAQEVPAAFKFCSRPYRCAYLSVPPKTNFKDCCYELARKNQMNPNTTLVRVIYYGNLISQPEALSKNIFDLAREYEFANAACIHVLTTTLSDDETAKLVALFQKHNFPGFSTLVGDSTPNDAIMILRETLWSACDRLFRRRDNAGSLELEAQLKALKAILEDSKSTTHGYMMGLVSMVEAACHIYSTSLDYTYDKLMDKLGKQLQKIDAAPYNQVNDKIRIQIGKEERQYSKAYIMQLSSYFTTLLSGVKIDNENKAHFAESAQPVEEIEIEQASSLLFQYLDGDLNLSKLSYVDLSALLDTAEAFIFDDLFARCQLELIERIKALPEGKTLDEETKKIYTKTAFLKQALRIRLSTQLWKEEGKIKKIQAALTPFKPDTGVPDNTLITLKMPTSNKQIAKSCLIQRSGYFAGLFRSGMAESQDTELEFEDNLPEAILNYLETGSQDYKNFNWEEIKKLLPFTEALDLGELTHHFKSKACEELLKAKAANNQGQFSEICSHLLHKIESWDI
jgi:hypothetical protein